MLHPGEAEGQRFQLLQPADVFFERLAPGSRPAGADGVGRRDKHSVRRINPQIIMMPQRGMNHLRAFAVTFGQFGAYRGMPT